MPKIAFSSPPTIADFFFIRNLRYYQIIRALSIFGTELYDLFFFFLSYFAKVLFFSLSLFLFYRFSWERMHDNNNIVQLYQP